MRACVSKRTENIERKKRHKDVQEAVRSYRFWKFELSRGICIKDNFWINSLQLELDRHASSIRTLIKTKT